MVPGSGCPAKDESDAFLCDETDALPHDLRYSNFDFLCTIISILTYIFDLVSTASGIAQTSQIWKVPRLKNRVCRMNSN
jgi:hypothetical protein